MVNLIFAVYDSKAQAYSNPHTFTTRGIAARNWEASVVDEKSPYNKYPEDFTFFELGSYDTESGMLLPLKTPVSMGTALEVLSKIDGPVRALEPQKGAM